MNAALMLLCPLLSCYFLLRVLKPSGMIDSILQFFCLFTGHIVLIGYILSFVNHLSSLEYWSALSLAIAFVSFILMLSHRESRELILRKPSFPELTTRISKASTFEKLLLSPLVLITLLLGIGNLIVIITTAPDNWDSMTYHLAGVAYYLQNNNLGYYGANYWAQVIQPKISSLLLLYTYLVSGRNENLTQLVQYASYWVAVCGVYGISTKVGNSKIQSLFVATVFALLTECLMQATTTQNDMVLTAYFGAIVYFLFAFKETRDWRYLVFASLGTGLSVGTKASSFLPLLSVILIASYCLLQSRVALRHQLHILLFYATATLFSVGIFALPAGYLENWSRYGNPIGPKDVREIHSFEGESPAYITKQGFKNMLRFGFDFLSLDGLPPASVVIKTQTFIRIIPEIIVRGLAVDLETSEATRDSFIYEKRPYASEDYSYWGVFGFGLIWGVVLLSAIGIIKQPLGIKVLSVAAILFFVSQSFIGPYDPWRGRYFIACAIFATPGIGICLIPKSRFVRTYLLLIVLVGCVSALTAVVFRSGSTLVSVQYEGISKTSVFLLDRIGQLTRIRAPYYEPIKKFDSLVPGRATVAVFLYGDSFEYPLFGEGLTRTIIPINSFDKGLQPIPANAEYLLYAQGFPCANPNDTYLGADWYLRRLGMDDNSNCFP